MTTLLTAFGFALLAQASEPLPDELAHLATLVGDQDALVEAARRFDRQQQALIEWDRRELTDLAEQNKDDLAAMKVEDLRKRVALIRRAWLYVLHHYPNNALANNYYGELLYDHLRDPMGGIQKWILATKLDEDLGLPHNNLAVHYAHHGQIDKGLRHIGLALERDPKNPDFLYNATQLYLNHFPRLQEKFEFDKKELYKEAMRMSRDAAKYAPDDFDIVQDYAVNFYAAQNFGVEPDWKKAAEAWQKAHALARDAEERFYTTLNEARTWKRAGDNGRAIDALNRALAIRPDSEVAKRLLAELQPGAADESAS